MCSRGTMHVDVEGWVTPRHCWEKRKQRGLPFLKSTERALSSCWPARLSAKGGIHPQEQVNRLGFHVWEAKPNSDDQPHSFLTHDLTNLLTYALLYPEPFQNKRPEGDIFCGTDICPFFPQWSVPLPFSVSWMHICQGHTVLSCLRM